MSTDHRPAPHVGAEVNHYYRQDSVPTTSDPLQVGDLWSDTTTSLLKRCTSVSPVTFVSVEGGSSSHNLFSATHGDVDELDAPADNDVLTYDSVAAKWSAEAASGHGTHIVTGDDHNQSHDNTDHTTTGTPSNSAVGDTAAQGTSGSVARLDHAHGREGFGAAGYPVDVAATEGDGAATTLPRSDHQHKLGIVTTKGDLLGFGTTPARISVGANDLPLVADSTDAEGVAYKTLPIAGGGTGITTNPKVEVVISAASLKGTATAGAGDASQLPESRELATNKVNIDYLAFDQTTEENAFFQYSIPKGWDEGTITFRYKWTASAGTGGVVLGVKALARSNDDPIDTVWGTEITVSDTLIATDDVHISADSAALTVGGTVAEGDIAFFNLARKTGDASDTLSADMQLLEVIITFTRNSYTD